MKEVKINIDEYLKNDNFPSDADGRKDMYNNNLLSDVGVLSILESTKLSYEEKVSKLRKIVDKEKDRFLKEILEVMLFNIELNSLSTEDLKKYLLSYNMHSQCFCIVIYDFENGRDIQYVSRDTVEKIIKNEILKNEG